MQVDRRTVLGAFAVAPFTSMTNGNGIMSLIPSSEPQGDISFYMDRVASYANKAVTGMSASTLFNMIYTDYLQVAKLREKVDERSTRKVATDAMAMLCVLMSGHQIRMSDYPAAVAFGEEAVKLGYEAEHRWTVGQAYYRLAMAEAWNGTPRGATEQQRGKGNPEGAVMYATRGLYAIRGKSDMESVRAMLASELMRAYAALGRTDDFVRAETIVRDLQQRIVNPARPNSFVLAPAMLSNSRGLAHAALGTRQATELFAECSMTMLRDQGAALRSRRLVKLNHIWAIAPSDPEYAVDSAIFTLEEIQRGEGDTDQVYRDRAAKVLTAIPAPDSVAAPRTARLRELVGTAA